MNEKLYAILVENSTEWFIYLVEYEKDKNFTNNYADIVNSF